MRRKSVRKALLRTVLLCRALLPKKANLGRARPRPLGGQGGALDRARPWRPAQSTRSPFGSGEYAMTPFDLRKPSRPGLVGDKPQSGESVGRYDLHAFGTLHLFVVIVNAFNFPRGSLQKLDDDLAMPARAQHSNHR